MRYYIDGKDEDEDKAATLSVFNATKGREHRQEPHASRLQIAVCTWYNAYTVH